MDSLLDAGLAFLVLTAAFTPLERLSPVHRQRWRREQWGTDLLFFLGQYLLWTAPVVAVLAYVHGAVAELPLSPLHALLRSLPWWAQFALAIALSDAAIYWAHRFSHSNALLWRFHRVHHTAPRLDWIAAHREHPFDNLYTRLVENLPLILLGFPLGTIAGFAMFRGLWALYIHSNVALDPGPLRYLLGAPRLHHWHHEVELGGRVNFANLSPLMDLAFGTYHDPRRFPERYGIEGDAPRPWLAHMVEPLGLRLPALDRESLAGTLTPRAGNRTKEA
jgi:sterol desaturase/sphingolipid hydroxylase (fatty acid hydroxylase superfamily)